MQRVLAPSGVGSWTVIGADLRPVVPVDRYLGWLSDIERSPNTVRAYALDLKTFWEFLEAHSIQWDRVTLEQLGGSTAWLRQPAGNVIVVASARPARCSSTVNRMLTAVFGFYEFHARDGVEVVRALVDRARSGRGSYKPFSAWDRAGEAAWAGGAATAGAAATVGVVVGAGRGGDPRAAAVT